MFPAHLPADVRQALVTYRNWVRQRFGARVYRLTLFGSFARGDGYLPDSDVDVLVAIELLTDGEMFELVQQAAEIGTEHALVFTPLPLSADDYRKMECQQRLLAREIERDGVSL